MTSNDTSHLYTNVNNSRIHYVEKAGDSGLTILFLHGRALSLKSWEKQFFADILAPFRLIAPDLPGHGLSPHRDDFNEAYSLDAFKNLLIGFVENLGLENYILAGLSLGGHIALQALPFLPGCKGVFSMTMPITKPMQPALMYHNGDILAKVYSAEPRLEDVNRYIPLLFQPKATIASDIFAQAFFQTDARIHAGIVNGIVSAQYEDEIDIIRNASVPVAIVAGADDQVHNLEYLHNLDLPVWRDAYHEIPSAGHLINWENPVRVNELLRAFADDCFKL